MAKPNYLPPAFLNLPELRTDRIVPYTPAPILVRGGVARHSYFSLIPSWSSERKLKFATHNARLETVAEKASWKVPLVKNHCAVPMSAFVEPIYEGELAGNMVSFISDSVLWAAGITDTWVDRQTGEIVESFAIITSEPSEYVRKTGHDRQPVFLSDVSARDWISHEGAPAPDQISFLRAHATVPAVHAVIDRPLKNRRR